MLTCGSTGVHAIIRSIEGRLRWSLLSLVPTFLFIIGVQHLATNCFLAIALNASCHRAGMISYLHVLNGCLAADAWCRADALVFMHRGYIQFQSGRLMHRGYTYNFRAEGFCRYHASANDSAAFLLLTGCLALSATHHTFSFVMGRIPFDLSVLRSYLT